MQAVRSIEKAIQKGISELPRKSGRKYGLLIHGNRIITLVVMLKMGLASQCKNSELSIDDIEVDKNTRLAVDALFSQLEKMYPESMMGTLFKNSSKCRDLVNSCV